jgi:hypothetical protein
MPLGTDVEVDLHGPPTTCTGLVLSHGWCKNELLGLGSTKLNVRSMQAEGREQQ